MANQDYTDYSTNFLVPPTSLMIDVGLWIALEATIGFIVGLGLASLMGQRTVPVILLVLLELILTPIFSRHVISHLLNFERAIAGVAMVHIEPGGLPTPFGGGCLGRRRRAWPESADTGVDPGGVPGDRGLDRVLDGYRGLADDDPGRVNQPRAYVPHVIGSVGPQCPSAKRPTGSSIRIRPFIGRMLGGESTAVVVCWQTRRGSLGRIGESRPPTPRAVTPVHRGY